MVKTQSPMDMFLAYLSYINRDPVPSKNPLEVLIGSRKTRIGTCPNEIEQSYLNKIIERFMHTNNPIEMVMRWGSLKNYGQGEYNIADIGDILGLFRFARMHNAIRKMYSPGIRLRIIIEDVTEIILTGTGTIPMLNTYPSSLVRLTEVMGLEFVSIETESHLLHNSTYQFISESVRNANMIEEYWLASDLTEPNKWESMPQYQALQNIGWIGLLPHVDREYYLGRVASEYPNMQRIDMIKQVTRYLGMAVARRSVNMIEGTYSDDYGIIKPIMASFVPFPTNSGSNRLGRLEYKVKDSANSNNTVPPWVGVGSMRGTEPCIIPFRKALADGVAIDRTEFLGTPVVVGIMGTH